jgi:hypothetical protein
MVGRSLVDSDLNLRRVISQTPVVVKLHVEFEESVHSFDYIKSIDIFGERNSVPSKTMNAYLQELCSGGVQLECN